jgi:hypothetical protein
VIPRIVIPGPQFGEEASAFALGPNQRDLRLLLDADSIKADPHWGRLLGFAHKDNLDIVSTGNDGVDQMTIGPEAPGAHVIPIEIARTNGNQLSTGVITVELDWVSTQEATTHGITKSECRRDLVLAWAARENGVDALVTGSRYLLNDAHRNLVGSANPMTPTEALALIGLYLCLHSDFTWYQTLDGATLRYNKGLYFWVLVRELLEASWRFHYACITTQGGDSQIAHLSESVLRRVDRALRARDRMHWQLKLEQNNDTADEVLFDLDVLLLMLGGAFDALGRIAHLVYGLKGNERNASWRRAKWLKELQGGDQALAGLMLAGTEQRDALELVARLRNYVHGEIMRSIAHEESGRSRENLVVVPHGEEAEVRAIIGRRGGEQRWGWRDLAPIHQCIEPDRYVEALVPRVIDALNALMTGIDVERLPNTGTLPSGPPPPGDSAERIFGQPQRESLRLLAGL